MKLIASILIVAASLPAGCRRETTRPEAPCPRIISFSPALTNILYEMNLGGHVVGVTTFCRPGGGEKPPVVGDRARVSAESILAVRPDVILIQQNPDDFGTVRKLKPEIRIEHVELETLDDVASAIERIGEITGRKKLAAAGKQAFLDKLETVRQSVGGKHRFKVLFVGGFERPYTGGKDTFIDEMIRLGGGTNAAAQRGYAGWKTLNRENILAMDPEVLVCLVSPAQKESAERYWETFQDLPAVRSGRVFVVTDSRWTIPSMRSADFAADLARMIHPTPTRVESAHD